MNYFKNICLTIVFLSFSIYTVQSQEMTAKKYENPTWVNMVHVKFKPMKKDRAMTIIQDYFVKADQNAGINAPTAYHLASGNYDMLVIWEMPEGLETLNYVMTPDDVKWMKEMAKIAGGEDKAMAKMEEFYSYVEDWETSIARKE